LSKYFDGREKREDHENAAAITCIAHPTQFLSKAKTKTRSVEQKEKIPSNWSFTSTQNCDVSVQRSTINSKHCGYSHCHYRHSHAKLGPTPWHTSGFAPSRLLKRKKKCVDIVTHNFGLTRSSKINLLNF
jgi:hypothetical protein